jgi:hypothetical protein
MIPERVIYGRCTFHLPDGFAILHEASHPHSGSLSCIHNNPCKKVPLCITLTRSGVHPGVPDFSESPDDMRPEAYPASISLTTNMSMIHGRPLEHLRRTEQVLQRYFNDFKIDFCKKDTVGEFAAARAQSSFATNFRLYRLNFAWLADQELATATMTVAESGTEKGWIDLRRFVDSIRL